MMLIVSVQAALILEVLMLFLPKQWELMNLSLSEKSLELIIPRYPGQASPKLTRTCALGHQSPVAHPCVCQAPSSETGSDMSCNVIWGLWSGPSTLHRLWFSIRSGHHTKLSHVFSPTHRVLTIWVILSSPALM